MRGGRRSHLKTVNFHVCHSFFPIYLIWIGLILRVRSLGQTAALFCVSDVTSFKTQLCCSFFNFRDDSLLAVLLTSFIHPLSLLFLLVVFIRRVLSFTTRVQSSTPVSSWRFLTSAASPIRNKRANVAFVERNIIQQSSARRSFICCCPLHCEVAQSLETRPIGSYERATRIFAAKSFFHEEQLVMSPLISFSNRSVQTIDVIA